MLKNHHRTLAITLADDGDSLRDARLMVRCQFGSIFAHKRWNIARHPFVLINRNRMDDWWIAKDFAVVTPKR